MVDGVGRELLNNSSSDHYAKLIEENNRLGKNVNENKVKEITKRFKVTYTKDEEDLPF